MAMPARVLARLVLGVGVVSGALATWAVPARAEGGFRCGSGRVVRNGETEDDVAGKCGDPDSVNSWNETRTEVFWENGHSIERQVMITYDEWEYDLGPHRLIRYVTFAQGKMIKVRTGTYGSPSN
jgi:hypothetical protein